jgi:4,5-DOPA dioxygenase extradiol
MSLQPALFVSHGSPMTALEPGTAGRFMRDLGEGIVSTFGKPRALLVISAHSLSRESMVSAAPLHQAVHDFGGFSPELYTLQYSPVGSPEVAQRVHRLLQAAGLACHVHNQAGLDHGAWVPLRFMFPGADVPVVPVHWSPYASPQDLWRMGSCLSPLLNEGVLLMASGSITHNLGWFMRGGPKSLNDAEHPASTAFREWFADASAARNWPHLMDYRRLAPNAIDMHPTDEHLLPWFIAAGAGGEHHAGQRLHASAAYSVIGMDTYAFGESARRLHDALAHAHA